MSFHGSILIWCAYCSYSEFRHLSSILWSVRETEVKRTRRLSQGNSRTYIYIYIWNSSLYSDSSNNNIIIQRNETKTEYNCERIDTLFGYGFLAAWAQLRNFLSIRNGETWMKIQFWLTILILTSVNMIRLRIIIIIIFNHNNLSPLKHSLS